MPRPADLTTRNHLMDQNHYATAPEDRIPLGQKIAFGMGMLGNQMLSLIHI